MNLILVFFSPFFVLFLSKKENFFYKHMKINRIERCKNSFVKGFVTKMEQTQKIIFSKCLQIRIFAYFCDEVLFLTKKENFFFVFLGVKRA